MTNAAPAKLQIPCSHRCILISSFVLLLKANLYSGWIASGQQIASGGRRGCRALCHRWTASDEFSPRLENDHPYDTVSRLRRFQPSETTKCLGVGCLSGTAAAGGTTAPVAPGEVTSAALAAGAVAVEAATAALGTSTAAAVAAATVGVGLGSALLDDDLLAVDDMRVRVQGGVVTLGGLVLDEGAVLPNC